MHASSLSALCLWAAEGFLPCADASRVELGRGVGRGSGRSDSELAARNLNSVKQNLFESVDRVDFLISLSSSLLLQHRLDSLVHITGAQSRAREK